MNEKTVGMLSKFTGVSVHTIKYYEKIGLLTSTRKEQSNYRSYDVRSCTNVYECVKYRNMGFSLKEVQELLESGTNELLDTLLEKRSRELGEEAEQILKTKELVEGYRRNLEKLDRKLGKWYVEEWPGFYYLRQTRGMDYMDGAAMETDGVNLVEYAPKSSSVLEFTPEYLGGDITAFSWGHGILQDKSTDWLQGKKGFQKIDGGRMFTAYMCLGGKYASEGTLVSEFLKQYNQFQKGLPENPVYGFRLKITLGEDGETRDYFRMMLPL